jgi:hypothetical protein
MVAMANGIHESLQSLAFPIDKLDLLPGNPRKGDVDSVVRSYKKFGQRKPIVARMRPNSDIAEVLAGNTQLKAARRMEWDAIAVVLVDDDDATAAGFALADNRTHDLGEYLDEELAAMLAIVSDDAELLDASGYDLADEQELLEAISGAMDDDDFDMDGLDDAEDAPAEPTRRKPEPIIQYTIIFDNEVQQQRWFSFMKWLKRNSDQDTIASRLDEFLQENTPEEG